MAGCSTRPVKTETVTVYVPTYTTIDPKYTAREALPESNLEVNDDLARAYLSALEALKRANAKLEAIEKIQPEDKP
jgi:hypothetical protein